MTKPNEYTEFLITSVDDESAANFAAMKDFKEGTWSRLPATLEDAPEAFRKESTPVIERSLWADMSEEDYKDNSLTGQSDVRILFAKDLATAARYASKRNWWLHAWKFVADLEMEEVIEYGFFCS